MGASPDSCVEPREALERVRASARRLNLVRWCWFVLLMPLVVGCDGCRMTGDPQEVDELADAKRPPFTSRPPQAYPITRPDAGSGGMVDGAIKPGHWTTVGFSLRSNRDDRRGVVRVDAEAKKPTIGFMGDEEVLRGAEPLGTQSLPTQRPVVLPKGQLRRFDTRFLAPMRSGQLVESIAMGGEFRATDSTSRFFLQPAQFSALAAQTYFFTVLTDRPERFTRLQTADWVSPYRNDYSFIQTQDNYRIVIPPTEGLLPLAETALDWTSTAVLFWDDVPLRALTPNQLVAVIDWLHFGGTLIVNGPAAGDALNDKKFKQYLGFANNGSEEIDVDSLQQFLESHSVDTDNSLPKAIAAIREGSVGIGLAGEIHPEAQPIGDSDILVERRIGRGRLVQSRIDLMSPWLTSWKSYDSFFNSAVLARPTRVYRIDREAVAMQQGVRESVPPGVPAVSQNAVNPDVQDTDDDQDNLPPLMQSFVAGRSKEVHPAINSGVRFASRDSVLFKPTLEEAPQQSKATTDPWVRPQLWTHPVSGLSGWKDDSPVLAWSRQQLAGDIGLVIPDSTLVFRSLLIYLIVLVPVNYIIFRLLGRLEWAWLAVVPLSILGAVYVAKAAQLDVGFARSRNEIALLEIPREHERGHLTRVLGLYNSLASQYRFDFDNPDVAISLIDQSQGDQKREGLFAGSKPELRFGYDEGMSMESVSVGSNSYRALHIEQLVDLDGSVDLQNTVGLAESSSQTDAGFPKTGRIINQTGLELLDAFLVERDSAGDVWYASIGQMPSGSKHSYELRPVTSFSTSPMITPDLPMGMSDLLTRLMSAENLEAGSARLIGRTDRAIEGLAITPDCQQVRAHTVILAHLRYPSRSQPNTDRNLPSDFAE